jgi:hypothetical protein
MSLRSWLSSTAAMSVNVSFSFMVNSSVSIMMFTPVTCTHACVRALVRVRQQFTRRTQRRAAEQQLHLERDGGLHDADVDLVRPRGEVDESEEVADGAQPCAADHDDGKLCARTRSLVKVSR